MTTSTNERTHFFIKNISLTLYSRKGWCWLCERGELETGTDWYILTQSSSDHSSTSSSSWLGCSTVGHWWPIEPSVYRWLSFRHLVPNWLQLARTASGTWLYNCLTFTCFCCSSAYLHRCISWLSARSRVNKLQTHTHTHIYIYVCVCVCVCVC